MLSNKAIVILIGNNGTIISLHAGKKHETFDFIEKLNDENKPKILNFFNQNKRYPIYFLLDTIDQTYKKKSYPKMRGSDLEKIIKRDLASDGDKEGLKNYLILANKRKAEKKTSTLKKVDNSLNKSDCLFITSSKSEIITEWLNFAYELPNRIIGIYMMPVESFNFFKKLVDGNLSSKNQSILKFKDNCIFCLVTQTKSGGARQIVFSNSNIVFTRIVNYNFNENNFADKYSQDIYSTFEYLKRMYIDLTIKEFEIINVLPKNVCENIMQHKNIELNITNHSVRESADLLKLSNIQIEEDYFDLLMSSIFVDSKKILKFSNSRIKIIENYFFIIIGSYAFNIILLLSLILIMIFSITTNMAITDKIDKAQIQKIGSLNELSKVKKLSMQGSFMEEGKEISIEKVGDMGRVEEALGKYLPNFLKTYSLMSFSRDFDIKFNFFSYSLIDFNTHNSNNNTKKQLTLIGKLYNKSGDIENLFTEFDKYIIQMKKSLPDYNINYNDLPRTIDFNQKYYDYPVEFRIIEK